MLGLIIGAACVIGVIKVLRHGRYRGFRHGARGRRWLLRSLFERLETTPGQEKAIVGALEELHGERNLLREELAQTRADFARALSSSMIDEAALEETFARHDRLLARLRVSFVEAMKKVQEALDDRQRRLAGDLLAGGFFRGGVRFGGPYRGGISV